MKLINIQKGSDSVAAAEKAVRSFCKAHKGKLSVEEHTVLRGLLKNRADALSKALGTTIHSVGE